MALGKNGDKAPGAVSSAKSVDFEMLVKLSPEALLVLSLQGDLVFASPATEQLFGWSSDNLQDHLSDLVYLGPSNPEAESLHGILSGSPDLTSLPPQAEIQLRSATGALVWAEATTHQMRGADGTASGYAIYFQSIERRKELETLLEAATQTDPVTGLYNRRAFDDNLKREWAIAMREKSHTTLIKVSLDGFDSLNEHFGNSAADDCLTKVAKALKETARRPADIAARTAASEFALLLPRTHEMGAETISAYIQVAIEDLGIPCQKDGSGTGNRIITASVGAACAVADHTGVSESSDVLLTAADTSALQARQEGGNRVKAILDVLG